MSVFLPDVSVINSLSQAVFPLSEGASEEMLIWKNSALSFSPLSPHLLQRFRSIEGFSGNF